MSLLLFCLVKTADILFFLFRDLCRKRRPALQILPKVSVALISSTAEINNVLVSLIVICLKESLKICGKDRLFLIYLTDFRAPNPHAFCHGKRLTGVVCLLIEFFIIYALLYVGNITLTFLFSIFLILNFAL